MRHGLRVLARGAPIGVLGARPGGAAVAALRTLPRGIAVDALRALARRSGRGLHAVTRHGLLGAGAAGGTVRIMAAE
jgi:hypothetical protein